MNTTKAICFFLFVLGSIVTVAHGQGDCSASNKCEECDVRDCDSDIQCGLGLICAAKHRGHLRNAGLNQRKAYCGNIGTRFADLCYDPVKVCTSNPDCDDTEVSNGAETCVAGVCTAVCDDNDICTIDALGEDNTCQYSFACGDPENACATTGCDPFIGCFTIGPEIDCNDEDECTLDECFKDDDNVINCRSTPISCAEGEICRPDQGCVPGPQM